MKNLKFIIIFLLFFLISYDSFSLSQRTPPRCENIVRILSDTEHKQTYTYRYLKDKREFFELAGEDINLNEDGLINWPTFLLKSVVLLSIKTEYEENLKKYTYCKNNKKNSFYFKSNQSCREGDDKITLEEFALKKPKALNIIKSGVRSKYARAFDEYNSNISGIKKLQSEYRSYPLTYNHAEYCSVPETDEMTKAIEEKEEKIENLYFRYDKGELTKKELLKEVFKIERELESELNRPSTICYKPRKLLSCPYKPSVELIHIINYSN